MTRNFYDIAILGAGAAGLSLGRALCNTGQRVVLIDKRASFDNDRTWCFFDAPDHDLESITRKSWRTARFSDNTTENIYDLGSSPYHCVPGKAYYDYCLTPIQAAGNIDLLTGSAVYSLTGRDHHVEIATEKGEYRAAHVVDTRPPKWEDFKDPLLYQIFAGTEVKTQSPCFDPDVAGLMTHMQADTHGLGFIYILPFAEDRALIEWTRFTPEMIDKDQITREQDAALKTVLGQTSYEICDTESGCLPMGFLKKRHRPARVVAAGTRGGAVRPSTGYALQRIRRWAETCAASIQAGEPPVPHPADPFLQGWMDRIFLKVLTERKKLGPTIKMRLTGRLDAGQFTRFMSDEARFSDLLAIIRSQPVGPFLWAVLKDMVGK